MPRGRRRAPGPVDPARPHVLKPARRGAAPGEVPPRAGFGQSGGITPMVRNYLSNAMQMAQTRTRHEAAGYAREYDWL